MSCKRNPNSHVAVEKLQWVAGLILNDNLHPLYIEFKFLSFGLRHFFSQTVHLMINDPTAADQIFLQINQSEPGDK